VGLDLASTIAPIAGQDVPVVTLLDAILIVDSIAAALWDLGRAARCAGGVAHLGRATAPAGPGGRVEIDATASASTGSAGSGVARGATTSGTSSRASSVYNRCGVAANSCQRENCDEAEPHKLAYG
jgi:hypothetical protein